MSVPLPVLILSAVFLKKIERIDVAIVLWACCVVAGTVLSVTVTITIAY